MNNYGTAETISLYKKVILIYVHKKHNICVLQLLVRIAMFVGVYIADRIIFAGIKSRKIIRTLSSWTLALCTLAYPKKESLSCSRGALLINSKTKFMYKNVEKNVKRSGVTFLKWKKI